MCECIIPRTRGQREISVHGKRARTPKKSTDMGLLSEGTPLAWADTKQHCDHVREHGIVQLLHTIRAARGREGDAFLWGDEIEYIVVNLAHNKATLGLRQEAILGQLLHVPASANVSFHPEYGRYMVESTPARPFDGTWASLLSLEPNMAHRRAVVKPLLAPSERLLSVTSYPLLGVGHFAETDAQPNGPVTQSLFMPDDVINLHPRFPTLSKNIRERRGKKVEIAVPVFKDTNTPWPWRDPLAAHPADFPANSIYMDAMGFGMGCCCLQLTFQGANMDGARDLYDAFVPLTPLFLALSAGSPIFRGTLADQDVRWNVISQSVDDRTDAEKARVYKSRYDSVDLYISRTDPVLHARAAFYNDVPVATNAKVAQQLEAGGLRDDPLLVQHFAHFFVRDPLVIFEELLDQDDAHSMDHFENIQSTNWQTVRFKPPPPDSDIGWRCEFRPLEVQFTDFENAAFGAVIVLLARAINAHGLCFYQPISQVDANMRAAHIRDPVHRATFHVRLNVRDQTPDTEPEFAQLTLNEIFNGSARYEGLLPIARSYAATAPADVRAALEPYFALLARRASGDLDTAATWIRKFVAAHPDYKHDSVITEAINHDLMAAVADITTGKGWDTFASSMLGGLRTGA